LALGVALLSFGLGRTALLDPDEGRYAAAAREMIASGDPIVPRFNGEPRLNKPPLIYWAQAAAFLLLGESEAAARLPSLVCAVGLLGLVAWWTRLRRGRAAPAAAVAVLVTTPLFFACARLAITDTMLALWISATLLLWHEAGAMGAEPAVRRGLSMAAALSCGLAVLTKGPVGALLPVLVIAATAAASRRRGLITWRGTALALLGILLVTGPWLAGLAGRIGIGGILDLLRREGIERAVWGLDHPRPFYYLLLTFWPTFFPWSLAAPLALIGAWRARREEGTESIFAACWLAVMISFFSFVADKNDAYLLPAAPALALLVARRIPRRLLVWTAGLTALALAAAVVWASGPLSRHRSTRSLVLESRLDPAGGRGDFTLLSYRLHRPSLVYYSGRQVRWVERGEQLQKVLEEIPAGDAVALVITRARLDRLKLEVIRQFTVIGEMDGCVVLFRESRPPPRSVCAPPPCSC
jgi:4-amino-4-deoxy-L-arabinose transferase-like glycosyltransferase